MLLMEGHYLGLEVYLLHSVKVPQSHPPLLRQIFWKISTLGSINVVCRLVSVSQSFWLRMQASPGFPVSHCLLLQLTVPCESVLLSLLELLRVLEFVFLVRVVLCYLQELLGCHEWYLSVPMTTTSEDDVFVVEVILTVFLPS